MSATVPQSLDIFAALPPAVRWGSASPGGCTTPSGGCATFVRYADLLSATRTYCPLHGPIVRYADLLSATRTYCPLRGPIVRYADLLSATRHLLSVTRTRMVGSFAMCAKK